MVHDDGALRLAIKAAWYGAQPKISRGFVR